MKRRLDSRGHGVADVVESDVRRNILGEEDPNVGNRSLGNERWNPQNEATHAEICSKKFEFIALTVSARELSK